MIRVLLVDDDALVRSGLRMMLAGAENVEVVAEAADGSEVLRAVDLHRPDVVLMDIRMPQLDGIAATRLLAAAGRRGRLPAEGHRAGGDRPRDRGGPRGRRDALAHGDPPAHLDGGRRLRRGRPSG
jgi:CheY-like chemotaxis protein